MHLIGRFVDQVQVGGLIDSLKNSGIQRQNMIVSNYDEIKFAKMEVASELSTPFIISDRQNWGELGTFVNKIKDFEGKEGIVVGVKAARHKAQEVKSVMEQSGAVEILIY